MGEWKEIPAMRSRKVEKVLKGICACMSAFLLVQMFWMGGYAIAEALTSTDTDADTDIRETGFLESVDDLSGRSNEKEDDGDISKGQRRKTSKKPVVENVEVVSDGGQRDVAAEPIGNVESQIAGDGDDIPAYDDDRASWSEEVPYNWDEGDLGSVPQEDGADQSGYSEVGTCSGSDLQFYGVINDGGREYTWYSENVLPGDGLDIPGRHVDEEGFVVDGDGYIAVASPWGVDEVGTEIDTPFGPAKVYDVCEDDSYDIYTSW